MAVDAGGRLAGIFTDSDLARLLEANRDAAIDGPLADVMTRSPACVAVGEGLQAACDLMSRRKLSELPVIDGDGKPVGLIDITDVVGLKPDDEALPSKANISSPDVLRLHNPDSE
jgi:arabinose-5-phosphate isomerase